LSAPPMTDVSLLRIAALFSLSFAAILFGRLCPTHAKVVDILNEEINAVLAYTKIKAPPPTSVTPVPWRIDCEL
jgi:hypothetical protein